MKDKYTRGLAKAQGMDMAAKAHPIDHFMRKMITEINATRELEGRKPVAANISLLFDDGHMHHHAPSNKGDLQTLYRDFGASTGMEAPVVVPVSTLPQKIIFHNRQAIGDILMFTCAVRDFKAAYPEIEVKVESTAMHIWDYNSHLSQSEFVNIVDPLAGVKKPSDSEKVNLTRQAKDLAIREGRPLKVYIGPGRLTNMSNRSDLHFANAYRMSIEDMLDIPPIPQGPIYPDVYMSTIEYDRPPLVEPPYWLLTAGEKGDWTAKTWPPKYFETLVDLLPDIKFVQLGAKGHPHTQLRNQHVIDFIGKTQDRHTGIRDLFNLFCHCEGSIGLVSFHMHLAAAFGKACVVIAGAREPAHFTRYAGHQYLATDGCLPCTVNSNGSPRACWYCDKKRCPYLIDADGHDAPRCVQMIQPLKVADAVNNYYRGGRLDHSKPSGRSKLVNVVDSTVPLPKPVVTLSGEALPAGFTWGGSNITDQDWQFIQKVIKDNKVTRVLEFGSGLSTILLDSIGMEVVSCETNASWMAKMKEQCPTTEFVLWDGQSSPIYDYMEGILDQYGKFDLAFVDGPAGGGNREESTKIASEFAKVVIVHDANREWERLWQDQFLKPNFSGPTKGGHRCHSWVKSSKGKVDHPVKRASNKGTVRMLFNGRGEGGAERSTTWIMNRLYELGHEVVYVPANAHNQPCGTFRKEGNKSIGVGAMSACQAKVDLQILYVNDWVWDFEKSEVVRLFENAPASKKVMVVNFRMGQIGRIPWTRDWDKYIFLNESLAHVFRNNCMLSDTRPNIEVLPPPTDLSVYFKNKPDYEGALKMVRHSSQGDAKYPKDFTNWVNDLKVVRGDVVISLMPAPSWLPAWNGVNVHQRNVPPVPEFLGLGNCFWYVLPEGYEDQGPKVIMEAQASGLACIAPNHSGPKNRIIHGETGWLCSNRSEWLEAYENATPEELKRRGELAREYARKAYNPDNWIKAILG